jgi:hypothetical protein
MKTVRLVCASILALSLSCQVVSAETLFSEDFEKATLGKPPSQLVPRGKDNFSCLVTEEDGNKMLSMKYPIVKEQKGYSYGELRFNVPDSKAWTNYTLSFRFKYKADNLRKTSAYISFLRMGANIPNSTMRLQPGHSTATLECKGKSPAGERLSFSSGKTVKSIGYNRVKFPFTEPENNSGKKALLNNTWYQMRIVCNAKASEVSVYIKEFGLETKEVVLFKLATPLTQGGIALAMTGEEVCYDDIKVETLPTEGAGGK